MKQWMTDDEAFTANFQEMFWGFLGRFPNDLQTDAAVLKTSTHFFLHDLCQLLFVVI